MKALLYCVKSKPDLVDMRKDYKEGYSENKFNTFNTNERGSCGYTFNGKIIASCDIDKVEEIVATKWDVGCGCAYYQFKTKDLLKKSCLKYIDLNDYLDRENGYALHLTNLKVFDKPKELSEYSKRLPSGDFQQLGKAPQNMMNVCEIKYLIEDYVLISIQPQHLCNILNGKKTIEVRRKIISTLKNLMED